MTLLIVLFVLFCLYTLAVVAQPPPRRRFKIEDFGFRKEGPNVVLPLCAGSLEEVRSYGGGAELWGAELTGEVVNGQCFGAVPEVHGPETIGIPVAAKKASGAVMSRRERKRIAHGLAAFARKG